MFSITHRQNTLRYPRTLNILLIATLIVILGLITIQTASASPAITNGLIGYWDWSADSGTVAVDLSGYHHNGTLYGTTRSQLEGGAYIRTFNGASDAVSMGVNSSWNALTNFTYIAITRSSNTSAQYSFILSNTYSSALATKNGKLLVTAANASTTAYCTGTSTVNNGQWQYLAGSYNASTNTVAGYIGTTLEATYTLNAPLHAGQVLRIGNQSDYYNPWNGDIALILIYNRTLSQSEISTIYNSEIWRVQGTPTVGFDTALYNYSKTKPSITIPVRVSGGLTDTDMVTVHYTTVPGTARAGNEYTTATGTLTFSNSVREQDIVIPLHDSGRAYARQNFYVQLSDPTGPDGIALGTIGNTTVSLGRSTLFISWDDTAYLNGWPLAIPLMEQYGPMTFNVNKLVDQQDIDDTLALYNSGSEIAVHDYDHVIVEDYLATHTEQQFIDNEITPEFEQLHSIGIQSVHSFVYPNGFSNPQTDNMLTQYFSVVRACAMSYNASETNKILYDWTGEHVVYSQGISNNVSLDYVNATIDRAAANGTGLLLHGHGLMATGTNTLYMNLSYLEAVMSYAHSRGMVLDTLDGLVNCTMYADFATSTASGSAPVTVGFTDRTDLVNIPTGLITEYLWDFGDGTTSTEQNPTHTYNKKGPYTVSLTVTNDGGSDTLTRQDYIDVNLLADYTDNNGQVELLIFMLIFILLVGVPGALVMSQIFGNNKKAGGRGVNSKGGFNIGNIDPLGMAKALALSISLLILVGVGLYLAYLFYGLNH